MGVLFKIYSKRWLNIRRNDFIACWAYEEMIALHTESMPNEFLFAHAQPSFKLWPFLHGHPNACWVNEETISSLAYEETISLLAERTQKCLKVEYLSRIEYQKSRVLKKKVFCDAHCHTPNICCLESFQLQADCIESGVLVER